MLLMSNQSHELKTGDNKIATGLIQSDDNKAAAAGRRYKNHTKNDHVTDLITKFVGCTSSDNLKMSFFNKFQCLTKKKTTARQRISHASSGACAIKLDS